MPGTYRIGVIGHTGRGDYGHGLDQVWLDMPGCEIVAVADADSAGLAKAKARLNAPQAFADWRALLAEARPDIVAICPRWLDQHRDMVVAAAEQGVHIYLEKPLSRSLAEADQMVAACQKHNVKLAIAFQTRYSPVLTMARSLIESGEIGQVLELRGRGKEDRRGGGEDLWVLGSHIMNLIHYFAGEARWCTAEVRSQDMPSQRQDIVSGAEGIGPLVGDSLNAMYGMEQGMTAYFASRRDARAEQGSRFALQIYGTRGVLEITTGYLPDAYLLADPIWSPGRSAAQWVRVTSAGLGQPEVIKVPPGQSSAHLGNLAACKDLIAAIEEDRQPEASIFEARTSVEMIAAVFESHRVGGPVEMPLATRENPLTVWQA